MKPLRVPKENQGDKPTKPTTNNTQRKHKKKRVRKKVMHSARFELAPPKRLRP